MAGSETPPYNRKTQSPPACAGGLGKPPNESGPNQKSKVAVRVYCRGSMMRNEYGEPS